MVLNVVSGEIEIEDTEDFINRIKEISTEYGVVAQVLDANKVAGEKHLKFAVKKAIWSREQGTNLSNDLGLEILLYASGQRQIKKALNMGVSLGKNKVAIVILGDSEEACLKACNKFREMLNEKPVLDYSDSKKEEIMEFFGITKDELKAVGEEKIQDLVIERVVLLDILK